MIDTLTALAPIFLTIFLGFVLYRSGMFGEEMWSAFEHLCFYVLFPALLVLTLATADFSAVTLGRLVAALSLAVVVQAGLLLAARPLLKSGFSIGDAAFTSLFQGATRWHGFIALAIVTALYGAPGVALVAVAIVVLVPLLNIGSIWVLAVWGDRPPETRPRIVRQVVLNPLILSTVVGALLNASGVGLPNPFRTAVDFLAGGALGISLLTVGAGLRPPRGGADFGAVGFGIVVRLAVNPLVMFASCTLLGVTGLPRTVAVICAAVPTAVNSYVLARKMGGDAPLMANIITAQVLLAALTLPVVIYIVESL